MPIPHALLPMPSMIPAPTQPGAETGHPYAMSESLMHRMCKHNQTIVLGHEDLE